MGGENPDCGVAFVNTIPFEVLTVVPTLGEKNPACGVVCVTSFSVELLTVVVTVNKIRSLVGTG
jgi:hypothetical protein